MGAEQLVPGGTLIELWCFVPEWYEMSLNRTIVSMYLGKGAVVQEESNPLG